MDQKSHLARRRRAFRLLLLAKNAAERKMAKTQNYQFRRRPFGVNLKVLAKQMRPEKLACGPG
jgi:hypothetical protein